MKILLIGINARYSHPAVALYYLRTFVADISSDVHIQEYTIRNTAEQIAEEITRQNPDAVGLSAYIWNSRIIKQVLALISAHKKFFVFLGGPEVSYNADEWLNAYPAIDCIITGPGEEGFRRLVENDFDIKEKIVQSRNPQFSEIPFPYREEDFPGFMNKNVYYESSRGCPFNCTYCISSCKDQKLEFRKLSQVSAEIEIIMRHSPKLVKFIDRTFNANPERGRHIWEMLIERYANDSTTFHFEVHPALLTNDDFEVLKKAPINLFQFEIGVQTAHESVRAHIHRKGKWDVEKENIKKLKSMGNIRLHADLIAGLPGEDFRMLGESFDNVHALGAEHFQIGILKLLPGTAIRRSAEEYRMRYEETAPYSILRNAWLSEEEVSRIKKIARLVDALYNSKRFGITMNELCAWFSSPWELYCAMAESASGDLRDISWHSMFQFLMSFIVKNLIGNTNFYHDCLAFDWFTSFNANRVPSVLKGQEYRAKMKKVREMLKKTADARLSNCNHNNLRIFVPRSEQFREKYLNGGKAAVFFKNEVIEILHNDGFI